jgi:hypothetical protein
LSQKIRKRKIDFYCPGGVALWSSRPPMYRTEDSRFDSRQGVRFLGICTLQWCCHNLICIIILEKNKCLKIFLKNMDFYFMYILWNVLKIAQYNLRENYYKNTCGIYGQKTMLQISTKVSAVYNVYYTYRVTRWVCDKLTQNLAQPIFCQELSKTFTM